MTLLSIVEAHRAHIGAIAQSWLGNGAVAVGVCDDHSWLGLWPEAPIPDIQGIDAPIRVNGQHVGALWVYGVDPAARSRLTIDAQLLSHIASMETDLASMTRELIDSQDQVVAMYAMLSSMRSRLNVREVLLSLARESYRLLGAAGSCAFMNVDLFVAAQHPETIFPDSTLKDYFLRLQASGNRLMWTSGETGLPLGANVMLIEPICVHHQVMAALCVLKVKEDFSAPELKLVPHHYDNRG